MDQQRRGVGEEVAEVSREVQSAKRPWKPVAKVEEARGPFSKHALCTKRTPWERRGRWVGENRLRRWVGQMTPPLMDSSEPGIAG